MVKKKNPTLATSAVSSGAAAKTPLNPSRRSASDAALPAPAPPAPSNSMAGPNPSDWPVSTTTKRDKKKARSLGIISSDEGNVILPGPKDETRVNIAELSEKELLDEVRRLTLFSQEDSIPLTSSQPPFDADHLPTEIPIAPECLQDPSNDSSEKRDSSSPVGSHTEGNASPKDEHNDPMNPKAVFINPQSSADDISDTAGSMHDDDVDRAAFVDAAAEEAEALPSKKPFSGFADEDDLYDLGEGFMEPLSKKAKSCTILPNPAASEASTPAAAPAAQISIASSLSKGKDIPSTAVVTASPPGKPDLRAVISSLEAFASQYTSLEVAKAQLQKEVKSFSSKLEGAIKIAAEARQEVDYLKEEVEGLKKRLKDEEASRLAAEARVIEKDDLLRQSSLALLNAADILAEALGKHPNNSLANALSMTLVSHQLVQDLLQKGKGAMERMHSMIFPKIDQNKTLGQLIDAFAINTTEVIEVFPVPSFTDDSSGACSESDRLQRMKDRIAQMEKDMRSTYALAAIIMKKNELAVDAEHYALAELHRATESLNFIALNPAEENKRIHERVNALAQLSSLEEIFWEDHSKASTVAKFQDRVQQVHRFFDKCYRGLRVIWKMTFPLNAVPPTMLTLMSEFSNAKRSEAWFEHNFLQELDLRSPLSLYVILQQTCWQLPMR
ncbi:hypothetical protein QYE76_002863 [Lolium multiflorum]|uniref:Uncharacterized protein n=1 Tax=Lolium multiflorum TaxID=4521 RepID=A0AAD8W0Q6_LOLMU|nr:hypothetical protein QYE76_002863 [Lolium multiflorum]